MPGGITVPPGLKALGVSAQVTRFKLEIGQVRRVRRNVTRLESVVGVNGPTTLTIHDHVLVPDHLIRMAASCPSPKAWPWQVLVGFPEGPRRITGATKCG